MVCVECRRTIEFEFEEKDILSTIIICASCLEDWEITQSIRSNPFVIVGHLQEEIQNLNSSHPLFQKWFPDYEPVPVDLQLELVWT